MIYIIQIEGSDPIYTTIAYYSFQHISANQLTNNEIKRNIAGPALLKMENNDKKQFLICYYEIAYNNQKNPSLYCQLFIQDGTKLINEQIYFIGTTSYQQLSYQNFIFQNVIQLIKHDYTIYIHLKLKLDEFNKISVIFITSIDLNLVN